MKYLIALCSLSLFFLSQAAHAGKVDTVYADICIPGGNYDVPSKDSAAMFGKPDGVYGTIAGSETLDIGFRKPDHINTQPIKGGSIILVWGKKDVSVDSSAGQITFNFFDIGGNLMSSNPIILGDGINIIPVPTGTWVYIELSVYTDPPPKQLAKSYLIDAVALVQDTTTPTKGVVLNSAVSNSLASYPNPFVTNTTIHFELQSEGETELSVVDGLGREVDRINAGYEASGIHEIPLAMKTPGLYFVRLFVNGQPVGNPLKISSR